MVALAANAQTCEDDPKKVDCRGDFQGSGYLGLAIDSFAAHDLTKYLNPRDSGTIRSDRSVFGIDFAYRLAGDGGKEKPTDPAKRSQRLNNFWIYGETVHGVRSADIDCKVTPNLPSCQDSLRAFGTNIPQNALYILRNATSLEGHAGFRYEFLGLQQQGSSPANLYFNAKAGFLNVAGLGGDLANLSQIGLGAIVTKGSFVDSYLEAGVGRSDLYLVNPNRRLKINAYLQKTLPVGNDAMSFFVQMLVDSDMGKSSDSVQTYVGVNFDLGKLF
jgi:hypothetical protein